MCISCTTGLIVLKYIVFKDVVFVCFLLPANVVLLKSNDLVKVNSALLHQRAPSSRQLPLALRQNAPPLFSLGYFKAKGQQKGQQEPPPPLPLSPPKLIMTAGHFC